MMKEENNLVKNDFAFLNAVRQGLTDIEEGRVLNIEEVKARIGLTQ